MKETDSFEAAAASAEQYVAGDNGAEPNAEQSPLDGLLEPQQPEEPQRRRRGRPRSRDGQPRERARRAKAPEPPPPEVHDPPAPLDPAAVKPMLMQLDNIIVRTLRTEPITEREAEEGAAVFAPLIDHYMPQLLEKGGVWVAPTIWVLSVYGTRALEVAERMQREREAQRRRALSVTTEDAPQGADFLPREAGIRHD